MRVTSEFWVSAVLRRVFSGGGYAAVLRRGAAEAGAVFIVLPDRAGLSDLLGPAPQSDYDEARPQERLFQALVRGAERAAVEARLERELRFDPDIWVIELEADAAKIAEIVPLTTP